MRPPFEPPAYPYDRLDELRSIADRLPGGIVDCSIGAPSDPAPAAVVAALSTSGTERGYPPSIGTASYRGAAARWLGRYCDVEVDPDRHVGACVGTKEFVVGLPHLLRLRRPDRDTVLYPAVSYPSYAMGAVLAGCRPVAVPVDERWRLDLGSVDASDAGRALCLWVNTPGNPAGGLDDLEAVAAWGRERGVTVVSDECYIAFTWDGPPRTVLGAGVEGVLAVHSLSKRSNLAGVRAGFYAGDPDLVHYLREVRKHAGFMVPGPVQAAAVLAWDDEDHVERQRGRYRRRLEALAALFVDAGVPVTLPAGGFYLWVRAPGGDAWGFARLLAERAGLVVSPGEFYGEGADHVRVAAVVADDRIALAHRRLLAA